MVTRFCAPFPNYKKVTRNDQIVMSGKCSKGCFNKHLTHYNFKIYRIKFKYNLYTVRIKLKYSLYTKKKSLCISHNISILNTGLIDGI